MTELNATAPPRDVHSALPAVEAEPVPVSFWRRIIRLTLAKFGAKVGVAWIAFVVFFAVFAPFLANTHPLLAKEAGTWSSPALRFLSPADVVLQIAFWSAIVLYFCRGFGLASRWALWVVIVAVAWAVAAVAVNPPQPVVYDADRAALASGEMTVAWYAPIRFSPDDHLRDFPMDDVRLTGPSRSHPLGTTSDSADLASNMIYASRIALSIGFVATGVGVVLGVLMGGVMGYFGGWVDLIGMRIVEVFESIPSMLLLLAFAGIFQDKGAAALYYMMAIIGFLGSFGYAEYVRAEFLSLRRKDFVHAARAAGLPTYSIIFKHILPNALTPVIVNASFGVASAILLESTLSFLNIGLKDEASWGNLLNQALGSGGGFFWWLATFPGAAIFVTVFSYNLIGEALRDALDPRIVRTA